MKLTTFDFNEAPVRVMLKDEQPWFVAADVCRVLDLTNSRMACEGLDEDEKGVSTTDTLGGPQKMTIISESGLYALVFKSRKPEAKKFRKWVTAEVLPALRQTGRYEMPQNVCGAPPRHTVRDEMTELRTLLITSAGAVHLKLLDVGRAQQVANLAARYLETIKLEGDAIGYETLFEMRAGEGRGGLLQGGSRPPDGGMQAMPQRGMPRPETGEPGLPSEAVCGEETLGAEQPGAGEDAQQAVPGAADLGPEADAGARPVPGTGDSAVGAD